METDMKSPDCSDCKLLFRSLARGLAIRTVARFFVFKIIEVEHNVGVSAQIPLESIERYSNDVTVMYFSPAGHAADFHPQLMNQVDVFLGQVRRVRTEIDDVLDAARLYDFEGDLAAGLLVQPLPRAPKLASLLLCGHLRRQPGHYDR